MEKVMCVFLAVEIVTMVTAAFAAPGAGDNALRSGCDGTLLDQINGPKMNGPPF